MYIKIYMYVLHSKYVLDIEIHIHTCIYIYIDGSNPEGLLQNLFPAASRFSDPGLAAVMSVTHTCTRITHM